MTIAEILAEIKRRATHLDSTGYITIHQEVLQKMLAPLCAVVEAAQYLIDGAAGDLADGTASREEKVLAAALSVTLSQEPTE